MDKKDLYVKLFAEYKKAHPFKTHNECDIAVSQLWNSFKRNGRNLKDCVLDEIKLFKLESQGKKYTLDKFWSSLPKPRNSAEPTVARSKNPPVPASSIELPQNATVPSTSGEQSENTNAPATSGEQSENPNVPSTSGEQSENPNVPATSGEQAENPTVPATSGEQAENPTVPTTPIEKPVIRAVGAIKTPIQDSLKSTIACLKSEILFLVTKKSQSLATDEDQVRLSSLQRELLNKERALKTACNNQNRQQKKRDHNRMVLAEIQANHPEAAAMLRKKRTGRPRIEDEQHDFLKAIVDIAMYGAGADERRRSEKIRTAQTLDQLTAELQLMKFNVRRSAVYLRLIPKCWRSHEGKRHISTVPVKLIRATNDLHSEHADTKFCTATIRYLEEIASVLGPSEVLFISQDDKARVPIGKTAANKQTPLMMHMEYRIRLPDHDWVVAEKHKLIPSVYAFIKIEPNKHGDVKAVTYSGPTYIAIRSGKHCSSTAYGHARDFDRLIEREEFETFCKDVNGQCKPVVIIISDGGPDENPRYEKTINSACRHFKKYNLDAVLIATNAPGRSAFNRVERRMAPLSRDLAGLVIDHQQLGAHLNEKGETVDAVLESKNFAAAGKILGEIWSETVIDGYPTVAEYISQDDSEILDAATMSGEWMAKHVRESHYFLQVVKCSDRRCCSEPRSNYFEVINRFIPAPMCIHESASLTDKSNNHFASLFLRMVLKDQQFQIGTVREVPYDKCCPSLTDIISARICESCGIYHGTKKSLTKHYRICANRKPRQKRAVDPVKSCRPKRVAAVRQREKMVVWSSRLNAEHVDWFDDCSDNEVDIENLNFSDSTINNVLPVYELDRVLTNEWMEQ